MKKWIITYYDAEGDIQSKTVQAMDVFLAITISALVYSSIIAVKRDMNI